MGKYRIVKKWSKNGAYQFYSVQFRILGFLWLTAVGYLDTQAEAEKFIALDKKKFERRKTKPEIIGYY